jgi:hypothetical protein
VARDDPLVRNAPLLGERESVVLGLMKEETVEREPLALERVDRTDAVYKICGKNGAWREFLSQRQLEGNEGRASSSLSPAQADAFDDRPPTAQQIVARLSVR